MFAYILIIGHFIADFFLQSSKMAEEKIDNKTYLFIHSGIYTGVFAILNFGCLKHPSSTKAFFIIIIINFIIDYIRCKFDKKFNKEKHQFISFIFDQVIHIGIILGTYNTLQLNKAFNDFYNDISTKSHFSEIIYCAFLFSLLMYPTAIFVKKLLSMLFSVDVSTIKIDDIAEENTKKSNNDLSDNKDVKNPTTDEQTSQNKQKTNSTNTITIHPNIGSTIGILERIITAILLLCNQYAAIGLVLTAKSIARFKQLEEQDFAEKYLIGTLTSLSISLIATLIIKNLI